MIGIALIFWGLHVAAQQPAPAHNVVFVQATGESTVSAKPDQALIDVGVTTQGATAVAAAAQNAKQTDAVLADLHKMVGGSDQLKTTGYSVRPNYQYPKPGGPPTISGYTATNMVNVKLDDLTQVGKVIDAVLQSGANNIQRLQFGLKNPQAARSQALREDAAQARDNEEAIGGGLGVHIVRVLSAEENASGDGGMPPRPMAMSVAAAAPTQVEAGTIEVRANVTLKVEVSQ